LALAEPPLDPFADPFADPFVDPLVDPLADPFGAKPPAACEPRPSALRLPLFALP